MTTDRIGILAAMSEELAILRNRLTNAVEIRHGGVLFLTGELSGHPVVLSQCGIGKVNAAMATTLMQIVFSPVAILNTGSAGGLNDHYAVGDIVLGETVCHHDVNATAFGYAYGQVPGEPAAFSADPGLLGAALRGATRTGSINIHTGLIASGDVFLGDVADRELVKSRFGNVSAVEMEGAAIAQVCSHFDTPCLVVRAVSDLAGNDAKMTHEEFLERAADNSALLVLLTLDEYEPGT